ncbi:MAG: acetylglutamate kinase [Bacteroidia bacterium]
MKPLLRVVKLGGQPIDDPRLLTGILDAFASIKGPKLLVHGGGNLATSWSKKLGYSPQMINGRRVTSAEELEVVTMVFAGLINKNMVARLQALGCMAIGLSGADGNLMLAQKRNPRPVDYGWVGDVVQVNGALLHTLIQQGMAPVCCALSHDGKGNMLNTNADTVAQELAAALSEYYEVELVFCFEKKGVLLDVNDESSVIRHINLLSHQQLLSEGTIHSGMIPKLENAFQALKKGVARVILGDTDAIAGTNGTTVSEY